MSNHKDEMIASLTPEEMSLIEESYLSSRALGNAVVFDHRGHNPSFPVENGKYYFYLVCGFTSGSFSVNGGTTTETCHHSSGGNYTYCQYTGVVHAESDSLTLNGNMTHSGQYTWLWELDENHLPTFWRGGPNGGSIETIANCKYLVFMGGTNVTSYMLTNAKNLQSQYYWVSGGGGGYIPYRYQAIATASGSSLSLSSCGVYAMYKLN